MAELLSHCMLPTEHGTFQFAVFQDSARPDKPAIAIAAGTTINPNLVGITPFLLPCVCVPVSAKCAGCNHKPRRTHHQPIIEAW